MMPPMTRLTFPNETTEYRSARDELLRAELELRRQIERVAEQRRRLPLGGTPPEDYVFEEVDGASDAVRSVRLSELFGGKPSLLVYSYMFSPAMAQPCPMCTCFLDGLDGQAVHIQQRAAIAIVVKSPPARVREVARARGWRHLRLISSLNNSYNRDYHGERDGSQESMMNVFALRDGKVHHTYASELGDADPGQNTRHLDQVWPLWGALDLTPEGRGNSYPKLAYDA
jgi:predicted dithiol-disulfide oxidoreductase (DUF899 family)